MTTSHIKTHIMKYLILAVVALVLSFSANITFATEVTGGIDNTGLNAGGTQGTVITEPTASPSAGSFTSSVSVTLTATGSTSIHYTTSGTDPTCSTGTTYSGAISLSATTTIEAISCYPNSNASSVVSFTYTKTSSSGGGGGGGSTLGYPVATPVAGAYSSPKSVVLTASGSTSIHYTLDGTTPTCSTGIIYAGAINIASTKTIKAIACKMSSSSSVKTFTYLISTGVPQTPSTGTVTTVTSSSGTSSTSTGTGGTWYRTLRLGMSGSDVALLQTRLNSVLGLSLVADGSFGPRTDAAVRVLQTNYGLLPADGIFGPKSRAKLSDLTGSGVTTVVPVVATTPTPASTSSGSLTTTLRIGSAGAEVKKLQQFLNRDVATQVNASGPGSAGLETEKFGPATDVAVKKFQAKYNLLPADGIVGPITRAKLNTLYGSTQ